MRKYNLHFFLVILSFTLTGLVFAKSDQAPDPYANTPKAANEKLYAPLKIDPAIINVVSGNLGTPDSNLEDTVRNYMSLWVAAKAPGPCRIEWTLQTPAHGLYDVTAVVFGQGSRLVVSCNGKTLEAILHDKEWSRLNLGILPLKPGDNMLALTVEAVKGFKFSSLELTEPTVKERLLAEAMAMRQQPDWFKDAGYGLMFQWTNRATPPQGPIKEWEDKVNDFDVGAFVDMVEASGAAYVIWSITWGQQYLSAPIQSLDRIIKGRTTERDLFGEMANLLYERGIKLIFYYHYGYECYHSRDMEWLEAVGGLKADKIELYDNLMKIIAEVGDRYGDKFHGWWFDGGARYYNCHFDGSSAAEGPLSAPFKAITQAARTGNPKRIIAYNSWIKPRITEYQDYYGGEGAKAFSELKDGVFTTGRQTGMQAHGCFILEKRWGHIDLNTPIISPKFDLARLTQWVRAAQQQRYPLSINLEMYEDGSVSPESMALLKELRKAVRGDQN